MERENERGFAHFMEHLSFRGSRYIADGEAIKTWQRLGATFGSDTNANTTLTQTVYKLDLPGATRSGLEESIKILSGMMMAPEISEKGVETERRTVLAEARQAMFTDWVTHFDPADHPLEIPSEIEELPCNVFGHICPVFFAAEPLTETAEDRRRGRQIPFKTKMRVVRRDNHTCQRCGEHLRDDEVEFDHIIPVAKGGSSEEHNIRLTCFKCNRNK